MRKAHLYAIALSFLAVTLFHSVAGSKTSDRVEKESRGDETSKKLIDEITGATYEKAIPEDLKYPENLLLLDPTFSHHVIVVEKATHSLHIFVNNEGNPEYLRSYEIATGETTGNKSNQGDKKTPEGIYQLTSFMSADQLLRQYGDDGKQYGIGAFVTNYPNIIDRLKNKTGSGIWVHSTNDETRIAKGLDSKGCVVLGTKEIKDISRFIELELTTVVIVQDLKFLREETWKSNRKDLENGLNGWFQAWREKDFNRYISYYHSEYADGFRKNYSSFKSYKREVFSNPGSPKINMSNLSIITSGDYAIAQFQQDYEANNLKDIGQKILYLKKDNDYKWKIVSEVWKKLDPNKRMAFTPSMRFFNDSSGNKNI